MAATATLNVRMDEGLKERGNQVFARRGISTTEAVRKLYEYVDREQDVPKWMESSSAEDEIARKRRLLRELVGVISVPKDYDVKADYAAYLDEKYKDLIA